MKNFLCLLLLCSIPSTLCSAAEIVTVTGRPDQALGFVQNLVKKSISLGSLSKYEEQVSTWVYSVLASVNLHTAISVEVLDEKGSSTVATVSEGLDLGAQYAPVVYTNIGPISNNLCQSMASHPETAYVVVAGNEAKELDMKDYSQCLAENILFTAAFNQKLGILESFSNWSASVVRLAAPSHEIRVTGLKGKQETVTNSTVGSALVAGKLALFASLHRGFHGAKLIAAFLKKYSVSVPALDGLVREGRALHLK